MIRSVHSSNKRLWCVFRGLHSSARTCRGYRLPNNNKQDSNRRIKIDGTPIQKYFDSIPLVDSKELAEYSSRPTNVKMLARDFIKDSLYNPHYGYYSTTYKAVQNKIPVSQGQTNHKDFAASWLLQFQAYTGSTFLQSWYTPMELFQPYYGEAIARYLLVNYKLNLYPYNDLIIYDFGGNVTLMLNILDYLEANQLDVYSRTRYRIISNEPNIDKRSHSEKIEVVKSSILEWDEYVPEPCFVLGWGVLNNLPHDCIRYDIDTSQPYQSFIVIDEQGKFHEFSSPEIDEWTKIFIDLRGKDFLDESKLKSIFTKNKHPLKEFKILQSLENIMDPALSRLSSPEFIPSSALKFFSILNARFPDHQLVLSDYDHLSRSIKGYNSPIVHSGHGRNSRTFLEKQGDYSINFPTNFHEMKDIYTQVCGRIVKISKHSEFLEIWGDIESTTDKKGVNPMLSLYENVSFLYS